MESRSPGYELLDFGDARKLERFGDWVLDRPCPAADCAAAHPEAWSLANARFDRSDAQAGTWTPAGALPEAWIVQLGSVVLELKPNEFGHVGVFPEHAASWAWLAKHIRASGRPIKVLNLFAYTGGATLAAAAAGAQVVHVDAARNVVAWARRNAAHSGLAEAAIRWIVEDVPKFVRREVRRGNAYDAVLLDPPSYGHGPKGQPWHLEAHLPDLLEDCSHLTQGRLTLVHLSCHTPGFEGPRLKSLLEYTFSFADAGRIEAGALALQTTDGRVLDAGSFASWCRT
ncbi:MAG: class I SAM-dependent methyltransferase [Pirellulales bacterium]